MSEKKSTCPKCRALKERNKKELLAKTEKSYGKIPSDDYVKMREKSREHVYLDDTLQQIYSIYLDKDDGDLTISFKCECSTCGFIFNHNKEINILK